MANNTKLEILQCATELFLEKGYTSAYVTAIANKLDISTGNLTFHYPRTHIYRKRAPSCRTCKRTL